MRLLALCLILTLQLPAYAQDRVTVYPGDNGQALVNPMMGWDLNFYSNLLPNYG